MEQQFEVIPADNIRHRFTITSNRVTVKPMTKAEQEEVNTIVAFAKVAADKVRPYTNGTKFCGYFEKTKFGWTLHIQNDNSSQQICVYENHDVLLTKQTGCELCGSTDRATKHHIVPQLYLKCMPSDFRQKLNGKILATLCETCHGRYEKSANHLKAKISAQYGEPLDDVATKELMLPKNYATQLLVGHNMTQQRKQEFMFAIDEFLGYTSTEEDWKRMAQMSREEFIPKDFESHGFRVMKKVTNLDQFVDMWYAHFAKFKERVMLDTDEKRERRGRKKKRYEERKRQLKALRTV